MQDKDELKSVPGGQMRSCVMAALHYEFDLAQELASLGDIKKLYNEDNTNILHFNNLLNQLSKLFKQESGSSLGE